MTVATNALLEERGARTALIATEGFTDVLELARQTRPHLYRLCAARPAPLVPPELRFGAVERNSPHETLQPLDEAALADTVARLAAEGVESVAVCLLHSWARPEHERRVAGILAERLPAVHVSASHDLLAVFREYERTSTTVIDAYLSPLLRGYLDRLRDRAADAGLPPAEMMRSSGGLTSSAEAGRHAAWAVLSGPAAGAVGAARAGALSGSDRVLSFDMGGTSCDVAVIDDGVVRQSSEQAIGGRPLQLPMVDVQTVGAGGGSIAWADAGGALRVGPRSAGAVPGPASYGRGGREPTVTDANLVLNYLSPAAPLAGGVRLDIEAAHAAVGALGRELDLDVLETAAGILRVADEEMLRTLRVATVERGVDPRRYAMVAFGGAGPMHAARLAEQLGVGRVLCPPAAGLLSALGLATADRRRDVGPQPHDVGGAGRGRERRGGRARAGGRRPRRHARRATRGPLRPALPRPVVRAGGDGEPGCHRAGATPAVRGRARATLRLPRPGRPARARERARERHPGASGRNRHGDCARHARARRPRCDVRRPLHGDDRAPRAGGRGRAVRGARHLGAARGHGRDPARGGAAQWTSTAHWYWSEREPGSGSRHPAGARRRHAGGLRRDGCGARALGAFGEHQGAPRRLDGPVRQSRRDGDAGRAHSCAPRRDARRGRGGTRRGPPAW